SHAPQAKHSVVKASSCRCGKDLFPFPHTRDELVAQHGISSLGAPPRDKHAEQFSKHRKSIELFTSAVVFEPSRVGCHHKAMTPATRGGKARSKDARCDPNRVRRRMGWRLSEGVLRLLEEVAPSIGGWIQLSPPHIHKSPVHAPGVDEGAADRTLATGALPF